MSWIDVRRARFTGGSMRARNNLYATLIVAVVATSPLHAQNCSELGRWGIYDVDSTASDVQQVRHFLLRYRNQTDQTYTEAHTSGLKLGFNLDDILSSFGLDMSNKTNAWATFKQNIDHYISD